MRAVLGSGACVESASSYRKSSVDRAGAEATVGLGLGANALVGGFRKSINLQPISVQAQTGLNVAAGVQSLHLRRLHVSK